MRSNPSQRYRSVQAQRRDHHSASLAVDLPLTAPSVSEKLAHSSRHKIFPNPFCNIEAVGNTPFPPDRSINLDTPHPPMTTPQPPHSSQSRASRVSTLPSLHLVLALSSRGLARIA